MVGRYLIRIVLADGVERYLKYGKWLSFVGSTYLHLSSARRAAKHYIGDGKRLGTYHADIIDDDDPERNIEL